MIQCSSKNIFGAFHWNLFLRGYIWPNVNLTLHLIWPNVKLALSLIFMGAFIWLGLCWHFVRWPVNQPAAIGQPKSHLTKCQPNPKSDPWGGSGWHLWDGQSASCNWPAYKPSNKMSTWQSDLGGVIFYINTQVTFCQMASQPFNQPAAIGQPTSHLTKCQPDPKWDPG